MAKPYIIRVSSQKGGVGKTTVATNLAVVLKRLGYETLLMDADTTNPSVGFHLGMEDANIGFYELMSGKASLSGTTHVHGASGIRVIPGTMTSNPFVPSPERMHSLRLQLDKASYDFVVVDTPPGFFPEGAGEFYDEAVIISTPDMASAAASIRLAHVYDKRHIKHILALNRVAGKRYELNINEIEEMYEDKVQAVLPEDEIVPKSIAEHIPAYILDRRAPFSRNAFNLSSAFPSRRAPKEPGPQRRVGLLGWLLSLFRG